VIAPLATTLAQQGPVIPDFGRGDECIRSNGNFCLNWFLDNFTDRYLPRVVEHIEMTLIAIAIGFIIAFAAALIAYRWEWFELPLAVPAIMAGLRVATVTTISLATIAAFITPLGLGAPIFNAIQSGANTEFVGASLLAIGLALLADMLIVLVQRGVSPWARARRRT